MTIQTILSADVRTCRPSDSLASAAHTLWDADCGLLPVVDADDHVVGTVTDRDLCMGTLFQGKRMDEISVAEVMAKEVFRVGPTTSIVEALACMRTRQLRRLPVVDDEGRLLGLVTLADVARAWSRCADVGGRVLSADDVARTLAGVVRSQSDGPTAVMVVEFTPPERSPKAEKPAKQSKPAKKAKNAKKKAKKKAERKQAKAKPREKKKPKSADSQPVAGGLFGA